MMIYLFIGADLINWIMCNTEIITTGNELEKYLDNY